MTLIKFSRPKKREPEVRLAKGSIVVTQPGLKRLENIKPALLHATHVNLWWDDDVNAHKIVITTALADDPDALQFRARSGRKNERFIAAREFLESPLINVDKPIADYEHFLELLDNEVVVYVGPQSTGAAKKTRRRRNKPSSADQSDAQG